MRASFIAIAVWWACIVTGLIGFKEFTVQTGTEVILETRIIDPRDLFRGDYVILSYDISRFNMSDTFLDNDSIAPGGSVYVSLRIDGNGHAHPQNVYPEKPSVDVFFIKGKVHAVNNGFINIVYGIESYFVPEGKGREIEQKLREENINVRVTIDRFGNAVLTGLEDNSGNPVIQ
ncbi:MAG: hypothetical protein C4541_03650 [Candidatus Auribacter fodinae]|jgi:uncharacterized membrane-anchored protein|uniref:GDYXXLXY protein n=1 Tax=Candidatus Auribacter fodinae TaxID=2093366 RepID=A0A3A4R6M1_9BACT|nr:MAG: hypothetical protein C4541_03650 [Candidatus Auribacter fodinae]